jgi:hypothetical protein
MKVFTFQELKYHAQLILALEDETMLSIGTNFDRKDIPDTDLTLMGACTKLHKSPTH